MAINIINIIIAQKNEHEGMHVKIIGWPTSGVVL